MDTGIAALFSIFFLIGALAVLAVVIAAVMGIVMLVFGIRLLVKRSRRKREIERAQDKMFFAALIADQRWSPQGAMNRYEFALHFSGQDRLQHRAFLAVTTPLIMNLQPGCTVEIVCFPTPMVTPSALSLDPYRGLDGRLPEAVENKTWLERPIDETGTVMFAEDYQTALQQAEKKNRSELIFGCILIGIIALRLIVYAGMLFSNYLTVL